MLASSEKVVDSEVDIISFRQEDGLVTLMDGSGSNAVKLEQQMPGVTRLVGTGRPSSSQALSRAARFGAVYYAFDFLQEEEKNGVSRGDYGNALKFLETGNTQFRDKIISDLPPKEIVRLRERLCQYFTEGLDSILAETGIRDRSPTAEDKQLVFAAGFEELMHEEFFESHFVVNIHPGDLTFELDGKRYLTGDAWRGSARAFLQRQENLYSTAHVMTYEMDAGPIMIRGYALPVDYERLAVMLGLDISEKTNKKVRIKVAKAAQETLKHLGDHVAAGAAIEGLFNSQWGWYRPGLSAGRQELCYRKLDGWYRVPSGIRIWEHVETNPLTPFSRDETFIQEKRENFYKEVERIGQEIRGG
ncbi:hypothetical protein KY362_05890 [Candidatus Woesearchaeota archaeon]|nr:hypothetical protein [Candidatus Woesearchaeota archaeon]